MQQRLLVPCPFRALPWLTPAKQRGQPPRPVPAPAAAKQSTSVGNVLSLRAMNPNCKQRGHWKRTVPLSLKGEGHPPPKGPMYTEGWQKTHLLPGKKWKDFETVPRQGPASLCQESPKLKHSRTPESRPKGTLRQPDSPTCASLPMATAQSHASTSSTYTSVHFLSDPSGSCSPPRAAKADGT